MPHLIKKAQRVGARDKKETAGGGPTVRKNACEFEPRKMIGIAKCNNNNNHQKL